MRKREREREMRGEDERVPMCARRERERETKGEDESANVVGVRARKHTHTHYSLHTPYSLTQREERCFPGLVLRDLE